MPRIILDTNVLYDRKAMTALRESEADLVLPAVAFAERVRQIRRRGGDVEELWALFALGSIRVESFGPDEALARPLHHIAPKDWGRLARDAFIAGHVGTDDVLWTRDIQDFLDVGIPRNQIQDVSGL